MDLSQLQLDKLNRGRTMRLAMPAFLALINEDLEAAVGKLVGDFTAGGTNFVGHAAQITTLINLKDSLESQLAETEHLEGELHGGR